MMTAPCRQRRGSGMAEPDPAFFLLMNLALLSDKFYALKLFFVTQIQSLAGSSPPLFLSALIFITLAEPFQS
ncbi:hypothetical protein [Erwinia sp. B116]|uniref:hypothetical protein n=1 Tax=Erwinia sp. B116 TaxID=1561024 RepID=UPI0011AF11E6|nr:hypothetical protein [Erwinia sp. B116]